MIHGEERFFLFGLGNRKKLLYKNGVLICCETAETVWSCDMQSEEILASDYTVRMTTVHGTVTVYEDEIGVHLVNERGETTTLTASPVHLPTFDGHPWRDAMRILTHDILINVIDGKPVPNFIVYKKPWYRDGAMMAMVLQRTGNLDLITDWVRSLDEMYDRNNAGVNESDNLGQLLYLLAVTGCTDHPLIDRVIEEAKSRLEDGVLTGQCDSSPHPVYQTKWLKYGLEALGRDSSFLRIPDVFESYSGLFWMDGHNEPYNGDFCVNYPYLSWAQAHSAGFAMDDEHLEALKHPEYPISSETWASEAIYENLRPLLPAYADAHCSAPHTWHAAEMFLYLDDLCSTEKGQE